MKDLSQGNLETLTPGKIDELILILKQWSSKGPLDIYKRGYLKGPDCPVWSRYHL